MPAARHCYIWKKNGHRRGLVTREEREREKERRAASVFSRRGRVGVETHRREGCIIKFIHSGLPNRSILIRDRFRAGATRKELAFSSISRRCKFLSTPSPPIVNTEPRKRHNNFLADSTLLCDIEEKVGTRPRRIVRGKKNEIVNRTVPSLIELIPSFNCLDLEVRRKLYKGGKGRSS